jgi:hypothetical protein
MKSSAPMILLGLLTAFRAFAGDPDPLFTRMQGHWAGHGVRTFPISGRQVKIDADVETTSTLVGGKAAILSVNHITETDPSNPIAKSYVTTYWVMPTSGQSGVYGLGAQGSTQPSSSGVLGSDGLFRVEQDLGGGYVVKSQTQFQSDRTIYSDTFQAGDEIQSQSRIEYQRITP